MASSVRPSRPAVRLSEPRSESRSELCGTCSWPAAEKSAAGQVHQSDRCLGDRARHRDAVVQPLGPDSPVCGNRHRRGWGWGAFWAAVTNAQTAAAIRLTVMMAIAVTIVNVFMGTAIAWVLVRDRFFGRGALEILIDIPFALPTIVAGLVLLSLYGHDSPLGIDIANQPASVFLAFLFVTLPFIVRMVQPVLEELEVDVEEAAASLGAGRFTTFRRSSCPACSLRSLLVRRCRSPAGSVSTGRWCCCRATCLSRPRSLRSGLWAASRITTWLVPRRWRLCCW